MSGIKNNQKLLDQLVSEGLDRELKRQKANGKKFLSNEEIDKIVDEAIKKSSL